MLRKKVSMMLKPENEIIPNITKARKIREEQKEHKWIEKWTPEMSRNWHSHTIEL